MGDYGTRVRYRLTIRELKFLRFNWHKRERLAEIGKMLISRLFLSLDDELASGLDS